MNGLLGRLFIILFVSVCLHRF
uniref:Uncharacterized protein n=1 Tax=Rhizophora mucronata TaxID=61149 RepID=A0A2P2P330_RHIMU